MTAAGTRVAPDGPAQAIDRLNAMPADELARELERCCGSRRWIDEIMARRPYADEPALFAAAESAWRALEGSDWRVAHQAVGERPIPHGDDGTRAAIQLALRLYHEKFGQPFISSHAQLTAEEMLMRIRIRLGHEVLAETRKLRAEQRLITRRRLEQLLHRLGS